MEEQAVKAKPKDPRVTIEFDGETYEVVPPAEWPAKVLRWLRDNDYVSVLETVIGAEQYRKFEDTHKLYDVERLISAMQEHMGGNS